MSKTVMIPSTQGNPWVCSVNNQKYSYEAGTEQTVPDEVAAIIDSADNFPPAAPAVDAPFNGGGADPVLDNAKSTGGIGWTEQGEQTVITWDGDIEGKVLAQGGKYDGKFCKISNKTPAISDLVGGVLVVMYDDENTESVELSEEDIFVVSPNVNMAYETFVVALEDGATYTEDGYTTTFPEAGIYSMTIEIGARVLSLTYGGDTIHKIDEMYLPEAGGGVMVVAMTVDENNHVTSQYTPEDVMTAMQTMPVYCIIDSTTSPFKIGGMFMTAFSGRGAYPILRINFGGEDTTALSADSNGWVFSV